MYERQYPDDFSYEEHFTDGKINEINTKDVSKINDQDISYASFEGEYEPIKLKSKDHYLESPVFGEDWNKYFQDKYGSKNVCWESNKVVNKSGLNKANVNIDGEEHFTNGVGNTNITIENFKAKDVPSVKNGEFNRFFNSLSVDELDALWKNADIRSTIEARLRSPGGLHEWHLVSRSPQFKYWNVTAEQIKDLRTIISEVEFVNPNGIHGGRGSTMAHNELLSIIDSSIDYDMFVRRLNNWANYRLKGGVESLPSPLQKQ